MVRSRDVCQFLEEIAPLSLAESWDNVGMLLGRSTTDVRRVLTCLTLTAPVAAEAVRCEVQMIVTHHPVLFRGTKKITDATAEGRLLLELAESGIVIYSPHTAFDSATTGINQWMAESLGLRSIAALRAAAEGATVGAGRFGVYSQPLGREEFLARVSDVVGAQFLEVSWNGPESVRTVAVACGSGAEFLADAVHLACDALVTGEARFHAVLDSQSHGINLVLTGHFCSERPAVVWLATRLQDRFPDTEVLASQEDRNPLELYFPGKPLQNP